MPWGSRLITVLQAEDLLPQNQYLAVTIIVEQAGDQGQARLVIALRDAPAADEKEAAVELGTYLAKLTGATFEQVAVARGKAPKEGRDATQEAGDTTRTGE